jgi:hypothetical protein
MLHEVITDQPGIPRVLFCGWESMGCGLPSHKHPWESFNRPDLMRALPGDDSLEEPGFTADRQKMSHCLLAYNADRRHT